MTYEEAKQKALLQEWQIGICHQGEECWCRTIKLVTSIPYSYMSPNHKEIEDEITHIITSGAVYKIFVEHIVTIHNNNLKQQNHGA